MSESAVKASRRDLRRAFGPDALATIEAHDRAIQRTADTVMGVDRSLDGLARTITEHDTQIKHLRILHVADLADITKLIDWRNRGLLGRLRWLLTGR